jgi:hypothetical protein
VAREHLERMLVNYAPLATGAQVMRYIFDQSAGAPFLARIRWLKGYPDQAMEIACDVTNDERARAMRSRCVRCSCKRPARSGCWSVICPLLKNSSRISSAPLRRGPGRVRFVLRSGTQCRGSRGFAARIPVHRLCGRSGYRGLGLRSRNVRLVFQGKCAGSS